MSGVGYYYTGAKGIELITTTAQAQYYPWHIHTRNWTIGSIRQGVVRLTTETDSQRLCSGQHFCIPPYAPHCLRVEHGSSLLVACFDKQGAVLLKKAPEALLSCVACLTPKERQGLEKIISVYTQQDFSGDFFAKRLHNPDEFYRHSLHETMRLVLAQPDAPLGVEQMAALAGYSQWHFLRTFQKMTGLTPHAFQLLCRLGLARSLLRAGTAASTAAVSAGFSDQSHMHKVFKRYHGMTPCEFAKASVKLEL